jgi:hypothetical protein
VYGEAEPIFFAKKLGIFGRGGVLPYQYEERVSFHQPAGGAEDFP